MKTQILDSLALAARIHDRRYKLARDSKQKEAHKLIDDLEHEFPLTMPGEEQALAAAPRLEIGIPLMGLRP